MSGFSGDGGVDGGVGGRVQTLPMATRLEALAAGNPLILNLPPGGAAGAAGGFPKAAWSPHLRATLVLAEFAKLDWTAGEAEAEPPPDAALAANVLALRKMIDLRRERLPEILAQAKGFDAYLLQLLGGGARPAAAAIVASAVLIGQMVGMHWKWKFQRARPAQVYPALMPVIATPPHASYPSNHALQSRLAALALTEIFPDTTPAEKAVRLAYEQVLKLMADRIAENREIAGVHFPSDSDQGKRLADALIGLLRDLPAFKALLAEARAEMGSLATGPLQQGLQGGGP